MCFSLVVLNHLKCFHILTLYRKYIYVGQKFTILTLIREARGGILQIGKPTLFQPAGEPENLPLKCFFFLCPLGKKQPYQTFIIGIIIFKMFQMVKIPSFGVKDPMFDLMGIYWLKLYHL